MWLQEVGAPALLIPPEHAAEFAERTLARGLGCPELYGVTWWCSHDVSRALTDFPELGYGLGLLPAEWARKPLGEAVAEVAAAVRAAPPAPLVRRTALVPDPGDPESAPGRSTAAPGREFCEAWARLAAQGVRAAVVLAPYAADEAELRLRWSAALGGTAGYVGALRRASGEPETTVEIRAVSHGLVASEAVAVRRRW